MKKNINIKFLIFTLFLSIVVVFSSCVSLPSGKKNISRSLTGKPKMSAEQLTSYFLSQNPDAKKDEILDFAKLYISEAKTEGINSDVAFAQMCLETGYLRFGNLVLPEMNNFCGLGAIDAENPGEWFETKADGVRAHIQHLHAYGTTSDCVLKNPLIDKRYKWVNPRGKAPTVFDLAGTWAADRQYGEKLDNILSNMENF